MAVPSPLMRYQRSAGFTAAGRATLQFNAPVMLPRSAPYRQTLVGALFRTGKDTVFYLTMILLVGEWTYFGVKVVSVMVAPFPQSNANV